MAKESGKDVTSISDKFLRELEAWHTAHGFDFALMIEQKPELYKRLLNEPKRFRSSALGKDYCRLIKSTIDRAEQNKFYKAAFEATREAASPKDLLSVGRLMVVPRVRKKRKSK